MKTNLVNLSNGLKSLLGALPAIGLLMIASSAAAQSAPNAPSNLAATVVSGSQIDLSWTDNSNDEHYFFIYRSSDPNGPFIYMWDIVAGDTTNYSDVNLVESQTNYYAVTAYSAISPAWSRSFPTLPLQSCPTAPPPRRAAWMEAPPDKTFTWPGRTSPTTKILSLSREASGLMDRFTTSARLPEIAVLMWTTRSGTTARFITGSAAAIHTVIPTRPIRSRCTPIHIEEDSLIVSRRRNSAAFFSRDPGNLELSSKNHFTTLNSDAILRADYG